MYFQIKRLQIILNLYFENKISEESDTYIRQNYTDLKEQFYNKGRDFFYLPILLENIDFESKISGIDQFKFWYSFLSRIDFSHTNETNETKKGYIYKYSCKECIPQELREKLQFISIYDTNYEKIIKFDYDYVFDTSNPACMASESVTAINSARFVSCKCA